MILDIIIQLSAALIGGGVAVYIYKLGIKNEKERENSRKREEQNLNAVYFLEHIDSLLLFIDKQVDIITGSSRRMKNWNHNKFALPIMPELKLTELKEVGLKRLYEIFVLNKKQDFSKNSTAFLNLRNSLHYIEDFVETQKRENEKSFSEFERNIDLWNDSLQRLMNLYNLFVTNNPSTDDKIIPILNKYLVRKQRDLIEKGLPQDVNNLFNQLIIPMQEELLSIRINDDQRIQQVIKETFSCKLAYEQINFILYQRRKSILLSGRRLLAIKLLLRNSSQILKESWANSSPSGKRKRLLLTDKTKESKFLKN